MAKTKDNFFKSYWGNKRKTIADYKNKGKCVIDIVKVYSKEGNRKRILVTAVYSDEFRREAHRLGGRWRVRTSRWSFRGPAYPNVLALCNRIYGEANVMITESR